jgi:uncharacterized protein (TIGR02246 family)
MTNVEDQTRNEAEIRELTEGLARAIRTKDLDGVMSVYSPELVAFDIVPPLQYVGANEFKKPWQELFELYQAPIQYEVHDLRVTAGEDVAFSHSLNRISGTLKSGHKTDLWLRFTACYRKTGGRWQIVHLQASVPADLATGRAVTGLGP